MNFRQSCRVFCVSPPQWGLAREDKAERGKENARFHNEISAVDKISILRLISKRVKAIADSIALPVVPQSLREEDGIQRKLE